MKSQTDFGCGLIWGIVCTAVVASAAAGVSGWLSRSDWERGAIQAGAAEYVIADPKTGATEFRWKEEK